MSGPRKRTHVLLLWCAATDSTFELKERNGRRSLEGRCIHCNSAIVVALDASPASATLEHIVPRTHGGGNDLENLALACPRCNWGKGVRQDNKHWTDAKLQAVISMLQTRRAERWRDPPEGLSLPPLPRGVPEDDEMLEKKKRKKRR